MNLNSIINAKAMNANTILFLACLFIISSPIPDSQKNKQGKVFQTNWKFIGKTEIYANEEHGAVTVPKQCIHYEKIKFKIYGPAVHIKKLIVVYDSGQPQTLIESINVKPNGESRVILLATGFRSLCRIDLWCEDNNNKNKTSIDVLAHK